MERTRLWLSTHIFYHGDQNRLIADLIPQVAEAIGSTQLFFFLRYWDGGPHVRLRLLVEPDADIEQLESIVADITRIWFRNNPCDAITATAYDHSARVLGRYEQVDYLPKMLPNCSVRTIPYRPERGRYGDGELLHRVEDHFAWSSQFAIEVLQKAPSRSSKMALAIRCGIETAKLRGIRLTGESVSMPSRLNVAHDRFNPSDAASRMWAHEIQSISRFIELSPNRPEDITPERVLNLLFHLFCNRIGVTIDDEAAVRRAAQEILELKNGVE